MLNDVLSTHYMNGETERRKLTGPAEIRDVLLSTFGLSIPDVKDPDAILARIISNESAVAAT